MYIEELHLDYDEKIKIIFEIILTISYLHNNGFVYRDLKPNNIIIDNNKNAVLIDFDRMVLNDEINDEKQRTIDFNSIFAAPEINYGEVIFENDIYSIGQIIYFIINEKSPSHSKKTKIFEKNIEFRQIYYRCTSENIKNRPSISQLIEIFLNSFNCKNKIPIGYEKMINYLVYYIKH